MRHVSEAELHPVSVVPKATHTHHTGVLLVVLSAVAFSTAGIFTKSVNADAWSVIFWRGVSAIAFTLVFLWVRSESKSEWRNFRAPAMLATLLMASGTAAFIPAFKLTSVANVSVIWATSPFVAALMAWVFIREAPSARTLVYSALALVGVLITMQGSLATSNVAGDLLALWMTLMMASTMVVYRAHPDTPTKLPSAFSALLLLPFAMIYATPLEVANNEIGVLTAFGLVFAAASVLLAEGARRIPSANAALISAIETPLAPIWALLILAETPSIATFAGGILIIGAVISAQRGNSPVRQMIGVSQRAISGLNTHLRKDIGFDDAHARNLSSWRDPLAMELRRLRQRL